MVESLRGAGAVVSSSWRADPVRFLVSAVLMLLGSVSAPLIAVFLAAATTAVVRHDVTAAVSWAAAVALVALFALTMEHFAHIFFLELADLHQMRVEQQIGDLVHSAAGVEHHERRDYADRLELLRTEIGAVGEGVQTVLSAGTLLVQIALTAGLLAMLDPVLLLLPLFAVPPLVAGRLADARLERAELETAESSRLGWHLLGLSVDQAAAKEIRLFGLQEVLRRRQAEIGRSVNRRLRRAEQYGLLLRLGGQFLFAVGYVAAVIILIRAAVAGQRSVGDVVLVVTLAVQTNAQAAAAVAVAKSLQRNGRLLGWLRWLRDEARPTAPRGGVHQEVPAALRDGIELHQVAFRYPGTDADVLRDLTVRIPAGATVAVVGDNGAGKSTLMKLLCRFYEPTSGRITVDGADLSAFPAPQWRARIAAGFQDFVRFDAPAGTSIGVGDLPRRDDAEALAAAVRRADAAQLIDSLPDGFGTHLGKAYVDGEELSGGQWQKIALSRAMMRPTPLLLVLDEPASALDPVAEHTLFERYAASARETSRRTGGITVFVSHRFSTVRMADLIVVISDGRIAEMGAHDELMAAGGLYAELFGLQAAAYK